MPVLPPVAAALALVVLVVAAGIPSTTGMGMSGMGGGMGGAMGGGMGGMGSMGGGMGSMGMGGMGGGGMGMMGMPPTAGLGLMANPGFGFRNQMATALQLGVLSNSLGMHKPRQAFVPFRTAGLGLGLTNVAGDDANPYTMLASPNKNGNLVNLAAFGPAAMGQPLTASSPYFGSRGMFSYNIMDPGTGYPFSPLASNIVGPGPGGLSFGAPSGTGPIGINGVVGGMTTLL